MSCKHCMNLSKNSNHRTYSIINGVSTLTCPELKETKCQRCGLKGHTEKYCTVNLEKGKKAKEIPKGKAKEIEKPKSKFAILEEYSSEEDSSEEEEEKPKEKPKKKLSWSPKNEVKRYTPITDSSANIQEEISKVDFPELRSPRGFKYPDDYEIEPMTYAATVRGMMGLPPKEPKKEEPKKEEPKKENPKNKSEIINWIDADDYESEDEEDEDRYSHAMSY